MVGVLSGMRIRVLVGSLVVLLVAGCGDESGRVGDDLERPPDLVVAAGADQLALSPFAYCWFSGGRGRCADGAPPEPLPAVSVDRGEVLSLDFPLDWSLQATLYEGEDDCDRSSTFDIDSDGSPIETLGPAGTYQVHVFGRGNGGDGAWAFELTSIDDRQDAALFVQLLWHPSERDLEGESSFAAQIGNLSARPEEISAVATVTSVDGSSEDFELLGHVDEICWNSIVGFEGPDDLTARVLDLGASPYEVTISFALDDQRIESPTFTWPDDFPADSNESSRKTVDLAG